MDGLSIDEKAARTAFYRKLKGERNVTRLLRLAMFKGVKSIHLIIAVLALSLFGMVTGSVGLFSRLSLDTRWAIGMTEFGVNLAIGIYGAVTSHRIAWSAYLVLSVAGLVLIGASTPIVALWLVSTLL